MPDTKLEDHLQQYTSDPVARKAEFYRYYSNKRIQHQLMQLDMLRDVPGVHLSEIGSYLGFATGLFSAAGFKVQTIDAAPTSMLGELTPQKHIEKNILEIVPEDMSGQDIIVCCETLEHLHFTDVKSVLKKFQASKAEWLLISVTYRTMSMDIRLIKNPFSSLFKSIIKFPSKTMQAFKEHPEPYGHKWELGYKGYPLEKLTDALDEAGFRVEKKDYVGSVQSVFILSQRLPE